MEQHPQDGDVAFWFSPRPGLRFRRENVDRRRRRVGAGVPGRGMPVAAVQLDPREAGAAKGRPGPGLVATVDVDPAANEGAEDEGEGAFGCAAALAGDAHVGQVDPALEAPEGGGEAGPDRLD